MRIVIGEDEALLREGLAVLLRNVGFDVVAVTGDAAELLPLVAAHRPELLLTDIRMPPDRSEDGLRAAIAVRATHPDTAVLVLSQYVHRRYAQELLGDDAAGVGYLLKQRIADVTSFCRDVHHVAGGGTVLDPEVVTTMLRKAHHRSPALGTLTARHEAVLALIAEGRTNAAIARQLRITETAVIHHASRIYELLGLIPSDDDHRRVLAVLHYLTADPPNTPSSGRPTPTSNQQRAAGTR